MTKVTGLQKRKKHHFISFHESRDRHTSLSRGMHYDALFTPGYYHGYAVGGNGSLTHISSAMGEVPMASMFFAVCIENRKSRAFCA